MAVLALAGLLVLALSAQPALAGSGPGDAEAVVAQRFADERARAGLPTVTRSSDLDAVARDWARRQLADGQMKHNPDLREQVQPARSWYENVGYLRGVPSSRSYRDAGAKLHELWMNSDGHRANILRTPLTEVGIGVAADGDELYATVVFRDRDGAATPAAPAPSEDPSPEPSPADRPSEAEPTAGAASVPSPTPTATAEPPAEPEAPEPSPADEPSDEPTPDPEPPATVSTGPGGLAEELARRSGGEPDDAAGSAVSASDDGPADTADEVADDRPPIELRILPDASAALQVGDDGARPVPLMLGLATIGGAVLVGATRSRRSGR